jgi:hypothetical protein
MSRRFLCTLLILLASASPAYAGLRAWMDNTQVAPGETVQLSLAHDGQTNTRPDLGPLKQDFDILGTSSSRRIQIINGSMSSITEFEVSLSPKHSGKLTVPSLTWDSDRTNALTLNVTGSATGAKGDTAQNASGGRVLLETEVDNKSPYVQAAVNVTVRVYAAVPLSQADLDFSDTDTALVRQIGSDSVSTSEKNGQSYQVVTRHFLLFPQHSGQLSIPGPTLSGNIPGSVRRLDPSGLFSNFFGSSPFGGMMGASKPIRLHGDPIVLDVRPRPAGAGASYWLPARDVSLLSDWHPTQLEGNAGDPITVDLHLRADGLTAAQLPDLSTLLALPPGLKAYPDQPKLKDLAQGNDIVGSREQSIALIADQPGRFTIPELRLSWWDTQTNQTREAILPARTLVVQPAPGSSAPTPAPTQTTAGVPVPANRQSTPTLPTGNATETPRPASVSTGSRNIPWAWISLGLGLLWLVTLVAWLWTKKRSSRTTTSPGNAGRTADVHESSARNAFYAACHANNAVAAHNSLLLWANAAWTGPRIPGLNALGKLIGDPATTALLRALDRACYAGGSWNGAALAKALENFPPRERTTNGKPRELAPLYR